jgi:hypothetical protein
VVRFTFGTEKFALLFATAAWFHEETSPDTRCRNSDDGASRVSRGADGHSNAERSTIAA